MSDGADLLDRAQRTAGAVPQPSQPFDVATAYRIQHEVIAHRIGRGEVLAGAKLGFTSKAKMAQMGVGDVIVGQLTDAMRCADGDDIALSRFIHPRIEPEVAFRLGPDLSPDAVAPALEIIDSRYVDFRFSLPDVIADNTSAAAFAVGTWLPLGQDATRDLGNRAVILEAGGAVADTGSTAAILGHPLRALAALGRLASRHEIPVRPGDVILAGAATAAIPFAPGVYTARVAGLGSVTVRGVR
ncbi:MAG TPA: 4-oxalocrotonate decarboxylase [Streptosporangiaceae bacterium]|jgi:2-oxo-3-hexenedioate decarboxylase